MSRALSCTRAIALCVAVLAIAHGAAAQGGRVSGVVNDEDGHPLKAATVSAELPDTGQTFTSSTDDKGRFSMIGLRSGMWTFVAQAPNHAPRGGKFPIRATTVNAPLIFTLEKRGIVVGALGGVTAKELQSQLAAASTLFNQEKWDEAIAAYRGILERTPALTMINLQIGAAFENKKDYASAIAAYNDLIKSDPTNQQAVVGLGSALLAKGDAAAAEQTLMKATESANPSRDVFYSLGELKTARGEADQAAAWYKKAAESDPSWGKPLYKLGMAALTSGDKPTASALLGKVVLVDPESPEAALAKTAIDQIK
jgi:tetratricopeptide (TPR) repeat protein